MIFKFIPIFPNLKDYNSEIRIFYYSIARIPIYILMYIKFPPFIFLHVYVPPNGAMLFKQGTKQYPIFK